MNLLSYLAEHFDLPILDWIAAHLHCGFLDRVMPVITALGDAGIFWIALAAVLLFFPKYRRAGLSMGAATVLMASELELPSNVIGIIADCGYTSPGAIVRKVSRDVRIPAWVSYPFLVLGA